jgi:hypothetical protein
MLELLISFLAKSFKPKPRYCEDCKHFRERGSADKDLCISMDVISGTIRREGEVAYTSSPVRRSTIKFTTDENFFVTCQEARSQYFPSGVCGPNGKYYKPKSQPQ